MKISPLVAAALYASVALPVTAQEADDNAAKADDSAPVVLEVVPSPVSIDLSRPRPIRSAYDWVTNADYPRDAWRNGEEGFVNYTLDVDRVGKVTGCRITRSTATPALDAETCRLLLERARFEPAQDAAGKPIAGNYSNQFYWDRREPEFGSDSFTIKVAFTIDERGKTSNCRVVESSGAIPDEMRRSFEKTPCPTSGRGVPARDAEGRPVARDIVLTIGVESASAAAGGAQPGD